MNQFLRAVTTELGEAQALAALVPELSAEANVKLAFFCDEGFRDVRTWPGRPWELAARAARRARDEAGLSPAEIDLIIYASSTLSDRRACREELGSFAEAIGAATSPVRLVSGAECANGAVALEVARQALEARRARTILVVTTDAAFDHEERLLQTPLAPLSDGASAFVVDSWSGSGWQLGARASYTDHQIRDDPGDKDILKLVRNRTRAVRSICEQLGREVLERSIVCSNNTTAAFRQLVAYTGRVPETAVAAVTCATAGHVFGADPFINLASQGPVAERPARVILGFGPTTWFAHAAVAAGGA